MKRILFVDDEPSVLDGLRRSMRPHRNEWEMVFVPGGREALEAADAAPFDVVVTDMRMPGIDGAELLRQFQQRHLETVRFVLSGHAELESVMRTVPVAHQFLTKPCDADTLCGAVNRACQLQALLQSGPVKNAITTLNGLPCRPDTYSDLLEASADPDVDLAAIAAIIEADVATTAKLLQLVNSAFFGLPQQISTVGRAAAFLGINTLRDLVLSLEVFQPPPMAKPALERLYVEIQNRSMWTGRIASRMFADNKMGSRAFTAGMLHDIGLLVMATESSENLSTALERSHAEGVPLHVVESDLWGVTHAEIGACLLGVWGLPYPILEAAAYHHRPSALPQQSFSEVAAVHVANALVESRLGAGVVPGGGEVDVAFLNALGVGSRLEDWNALVEEQLPIDSAGPR